MLGGNFNLPSKKEMYDDICRMQVWKRKTMPNAGAARAYMIQTHQIHYYDQLLKDMGADIRRKSQGRILGVFREIFEPYRPRDFSTVVTGEYKFLRHESKPAGTKQKPFCCELFVFVAMILLLVALFQI